ncbi:MAG: hypothetical protein KAS32_23275 [Candidatus Peribacteraceae bacterium]|nr:hypothetical protein [Candidatus Peribacteraceae bacterium]
MNWKYTDQSERVVASADGTQSHSVNAKVIQDWIAEGNTPGPADPPPGLPTNDELYDRLIQKTPLFMAFLKAYDDGSVVSGSNDLAALEAAIKAKM